MLEFLKRLFSKKEGPFNPRDFFSGQLVELEYRDPKSMGILSNGTTTLTRLNPDEMDNRVIRGTIERINWDNVLNCHVITVKTFKMKNNHSQERTYLFLETEIKYCRGLK